MFFTYWYIVTTNIPAIMLTQAHTRFLNTICNRLKSEFAVSLKHKLLLFFWEAAFCGFFFLLLN